ncbi:MAG: hypothetical protein F6K25_15025 [Okeania sp. SIO2G4]|nr:MULTISPECIES: hypothetical protein [unclassified Okeania]NEP07145.1 hypothetical protein [Okeania sp. SIO4D6]NEP39814.1 hypothetical protein [Okeania sp. SIO2H7]NEP73239.1 hypothetical protein [Okeania sp. SIO2G5]NEP94103.1 hypothetical protein [Okeania sp. SIO2F5]NEQ91933.1 hypothetical protein [Okeania sp. SIO2G4]
MGKNHRQPYPTKIVWINFILFFPLLIATDRFSVLVSNFTNLVVNFNVAI